MAFLQFTKLRRECTEEAKISLLEVTPINPIPVTDSSNNLRENFPRVCISAVLLPFCLLILAPFVLCVCYYCAEQHLEGIEWILTSVEACIASLEWIVLWLQPLYNLSSWMTYFGGLGGVLGTLAMTYFGHRYADKWKSCTEQAQTVFDSLCSFCKNLKPVASAFYNWYIWLIGGVIVLSLEFFLAGVLTFIYTFVMVIPYIVTPLVFSYFKFGEFLDWFRSRREYSTKLKNEYEHQLYVKMRQELFDGNLDRDEFEDALFDCEDDCWSTAYEKGPVREDNWIVTFLACLKPLMRLCLALGFVAYASPNALPEFDMKDHISFRVDIDKCWQHLEITNEDIVDINVTASRGWVHSYQACYDCAITTSTATNGTVASNETAYFACAELRADQLKTWYHDSIRQNTGEQKLPMWTVYLNTCSNRDDYIALACKRIKYWLKTDTPSSPIDPLIDVTKKTVKSLKAKIASLKQQSIANYVGQIKARAESLFWYIVKLVCFLGLWHALAYIMWLV